MTRAALPRMTGAAGWALIDHALRQALRGRRLITILALALAPAAFGIAMDALSDESTRDLHEGVLYVIAIGIVLPLIALTLGSAVVREELELGTMVHIVTRPVARPLVALARLAGTVIATGVIATGMLLVATVAIGGLAIEPFMDALSVGWFAAAAYTALFAALGAATKRGVLAGIAWLVVWDFFFASFGSFLSRFTIAFWVRSLGAAQASTTNIVRSTVGGDLASGGVSALVLLFIALAMAGIAAWLFAVRELPRVEHE